MDKQEETINQTPLHQSNARIRAFLISLCCYTVLITFLGFYKFNEKKHHFFEQFPRKKQEAAPIKMLTPPPAKQTKQPLQKQIMPSEKNKAMPQKTEIAQKPTVQQPTQKKTIEATPENLIVPPTAKKPAEKITEQTESIQEVARPSQQKNILKQLRSPLRPKTNKDKQTTSKKQNERKRQSAWKRPSIKQNQDVATDQQKNRPPMHTQKITKAFSEFVEEKQKKMLMPLTQNNPSKDGYCWGEIAQQNAQRAEALSFFEHFLFSFCELSYQNQLSLKGIITKSHTITLNVTITKDRKIIHIERICPSPLHQFNDHVAYLLSIMTPPLFPAHHKGNELIVPLNIQITINPTIHSLYFVPVQF